MKLLRLLSTGKSLVGLRDNEREFHVNDAALLPRFEGKKNPFKTTTLPAHHQAPQQEHPEVMVAVAPEMRRQTVCEPKGARLSLAPGRAERVRLRVAKTGLNWAAQFSKKIKATKQALAQRVKNVFRRKAAADQKSAESVEPAQAELRLDEVKVVRNDLSDSDIEIIPRAEGLLSAAVPGDRKRVLPPEVVANTAWSRVSSRVFGPEKVI